MTEEPPPRGALAAKQGGDRGVATEAPVVDEKPDVVGDVVTGQPEGFVVDPLPGLRLRKDVERALKAPHPGCAERTIAVEDEKGRLRGHIPMLRGGHRGILGARDA